jgi:beta-phosphoglucomutase
MIKAIIFDMDGVLVDSEAFICQAATAMFAEKGLSVQEADFLPFVGAGEDRYLGGVAQKYGIPFDVVTDKARTYAIYQELIVGALHPLPGVHHFIDACRTHGLKLAVASSADLVKVQANLNEIGLPFTAFDTVVNGLDVEHKKPAPDIFLLAAERLDTPPEHCLVVEDAINGVEAAKAAGAHCLGLTTSFTPQQLQQADWTAADLSTIPPELLKTIGL